MKVTGKPKDEMKREMDKIRKYFKQTRNAVIELKSTPEIMFHGDSGKNPKLRNSPKGKSKRDK